MATTLQPSMITTLTSDLVDETGSTSGVTGSSTSLQATMENSDNVFDNSATDAMMNDQSQLQDSFTTSSTDSSQFPMQQATQQLPSDHVTVATTDLISGTSVMDMLQNDSATSAVNVSDKTGTIDATKATGASNSSDTDNASDMDNSASDSSSASGSTSDAIGLATDSTDNVIGDVTQTNESGASTDVVGDPKNVNSATTDINVAVTDNMPTDVIGATDLNAGTTSVSKSIGVTITPTSVSMSVTSIAQTVSVSDGGGSINPSLSSDHASVDQTVTDQTATDIYSRYTPKQTTFTSGPQTLDTGTIQSSSAAPVPEVTGKPVPPDSNKQSTILGGGLSDNILYIGVPVAGLALLILLLVCVLCIRRRKHKQKRSPVKEGDQDLWMNSTSEIPLTGPRSNLPETNGGDLISPQKDLGCTRYEAVFDFQGSHSNHLSLQQGDIVIVQRKEDTGWWRGTKGNNSGWFPTNYVQSAPLQDKLSTENELDNDDPLNITSFMLKKSNSVSPRDSLKIEEEISAEPIYCKIQPKDQRNSIHKLSDRSASTTPTKPESAEYLTPVVASSNECVALYPYEAHNPGELLLHKGDLITCKEQDKNGWIKGTNNTTKKEGWCPASYLQKVEKTQIKAAPDPTSYQQLHINTDRTNKQDLIGIVHKAVHTFTGEKAGDLEFECGDYITVFQVLENGWWLGSKDKTVGWFPGSYVEMIEHLSNSSSSPSPVSTQSSTTEIMGSQEFKPSTLDLPSPSPTPVTPTTPSKLRPMRKAPPPPLKIVNSTHNNTPNQTHNQTTDSKLPTVHGNKTPKQGRPKVAPPEPPVRGKVNDTFQDDNSPLYEPIGHKNNSAETNDHEGKANEKVVDSTSDPNVTGKPVKVKPPVPKRFIKPKLVTVPRAEVKIPDLRKSLGDGELMKLRSPPPAKPAIPKLGPIRAKLTAPKPLMDESLEEQDLLFQVNSQRKFDPIVKQASSDQDSISPESPPYVSMSSFGATFGKAETTSTPVARTSTFSAPKPVNQTSTFSSPKPQKPPSPIVIEPERSPAQVPLSEPAIIDVKDITETTPEPVPNIPESDTTVNAMDDIVDINKDKADISITDIDPKLDIDTEKEIQNNEKKQSDESPNASSTETVPQNNISSAEKPKPKSSIPLTPTMKASKLPPPKHSSSKLKEEIPSPKLESEVIEEKPKVDDKPKVVTPTEKVSKLPKSNQPVSKIPALNSQQTKSEPDLNVFQYPNVNDTTKDTKPEMTIYKPESHVPVANDNADARPRAESFGKPPLAPKPKSNLPKVLPKPKTKIKDQITDNKENAKTPDKADIQIEPKEVKNEVKDHSESSASSPTKSVENTNDNSESANTENQTDSRPRNTSESDSEIKPQSKLPLTSGAQQKAPAKVKKSGIPAPGVRKPSLERARESDTEPENTTSSPRKTESPKLVRKLESPQVARKQRETKSSKEPGEHKSLRNRSNSPAGRTGIPKSVRNRSNSPAAKPSGLPTPGSKVTPKQKRSGLVPPKKVSVNGQGKQSPVDIEASLPSEDHNTSSEKDDSFEQPSSEKHEKPPKSVTLTKQPSQDGKPPKSGKSLLPVIHKSLESGVTSPNGVTSGNKQKRGIPMPKSARPPAPKPALDDDTQSNGSIEVVKKKTLYQAVRGYTAQCDGELTFTEGTFIKELSDCDRPGWHVGMLADGTTGLYPAKYFQPSPVSAQSEA